MISRGAGGEFLGSDLVLVASLKNVNQYQIRARGSIDDGLETLFATLLRSPLIAGEA